jgi:hypothetical protein
MPQKTKNFSAYLLLGSIFIGLLTFIPTPAASLRTSLDESMDAKVEAFIKEFEAVSKTMVEAIANESTTAGIDKAQKAFDAKKTSLRDLFNKFKNATGKEVTEATQKKLVDSITKNGRLLTDTFSRHAEDYADEPEAATKFQKLMKDYIDIFAM